MLPGTLNIFSVMGSETLRLFVSEAALVNGRRGVAQSLKDKYSTKLQQARPISKPFFTNALRDKFAETALLAESQKNRKKIGGKMMMTDYGKVIAVR